MTNKEEFEPILEEMRRDWNERATQDAQQYVYTRDVATDESDFEDSGRVNYDQLVRPFLPLLLCGRSPQSCRVVEIGCGLGRITRPFAENFLEVHGVDVSAEMIERAGARLRDCPNASFHVSSGMDLSCLPDKHFDLAFSYLVFQHIPSRAVIQNYIRETARVLKPGGAFKFQLQGYQDPDYRWSKKDTWHGQTFSFAEAARMLAEAGFYLLSVTGAGTQYFFLTARKLAEEDRPLLSYILPGQGGVAGQLLEGWHHPALGDCLSIEPCCRTILAVPPGPECRFFLHLLVGSIEPFLATTLQVSVNEFALGSAAIDRSGDHHFEWPVPPDAISGSRAVVTMEFLPASEFVGASVRCLGIYAPSESVQGLEAKQQHLEEQSAWNRQLGSTHLEFDDRTAWALKMDAERKAA
ncbi:MAG: class I SAM-dependent methyltransferase, partial [Acidobacteriota bacterium]